MLNATHAVDVAPPRGSEDDEGVHALMLSRPRWPRRPRTARPSRGLARRWRPGSGTPRNWAHPDSGREPDCRPP
eukprot:3156970-Alexandrium_andersonii.AAC.1